MRISRKCIFGLEVIAIVVFLTHCSRKEEPRVALQPFENVSPSLTDTLAHVLEKMYGARVIILARRNLPADAFVNVKSSRYRADTIIKRLGIEKPDSVDYIMGVTTRDISFTKREWHGKIKSPESKYADWGIFGLAYSPGTSSVVSTFRVGHPAKAVTSDRIKKIAVHEFGHNLGLRHCAHGMCIMRDAVESIKTIDAVEMRLCAACKSKLD